jgi:hypothetical protein
MKMPKTFYPHVKKFFAPSLCDLLNPIYAVPGGIPLLPARGNKPLELSFEQQLKALVYFHLEEHTSGCHLLQCIDEDDFAREFIADSKGIKKSTFFEAINSRGLEQLQYIYEHLQTQAAAFLPSAHTDLGNLIAIDGTLIQAVLSMHWADYRRVSKKAKAHFGFDVNKGIPRKLFLTHGNAGERPFISQILSPGQTGIMDRGYQCHKTFDELQAEGKHFLCRIKANTTKTCIQSNPVPENSIVFYDAIVLLGTPGVNQSEKSLRVVGYRIGNVNYWIATDRFDLSAEQIAEAYKLRWDIETFFGWWKRHLRVYHLIARTKYGLMVQILAGLITYLLLAIYCQKHFNEKVSIARVRQLRNQIKNELRHTGAMATEPAHAREKSAEGLYAKT